MIMTKELNKTQIKALEDMITRRMNNTEETREQASEHIANYLKSALPKND